MITERHPYSEAICAGIWICQGSRDEKSSQKGMAHLAEHLVFKGTKKRTAYQIARVMESRGGDLNAFTSKENICFHATSLAKDLELNLELLADLVLNATIPEKEFDNEKNVILQEIAMYEDSFEEYIFDAFNEEVYQHHPMGWPILGTEGSVRSIERKHVFEYLKEITSPENIIVSVVGNVEHDDVVEFAQKKFSHLKKVGRKKNNRTRPRFHKLKKHIDKETEQSHILIGFNAPSLRHRLRFASFIVNTALGGGMTSILYQNIREKRGLAYSVYSTISNASDSGMAMIYVGTEPKQQNRVIDLVLEDLKKIKKKGFNKNSLKRYKTQINGFLTLNDDDLESRMTSVCMNEQVFGAYRSLHDLIDSIEGVQVGDIDEFLDTYLNLDRLAIMTLGPKEKKK